MDKNKVKLALHSAEEETKIIINKFLEVDTFNFTDLCWWWNPSNFWTANKKYAENMLKILVEEKCCIRISVRGGSAYEKTPPFVDLLSEMLRLEELLKGT